MKDRYDYVIYPPDCGVVSHGRDQICFDECYLAEIEQRSWGNDGQATSRVGGGRAISQSGLQRTKGETTSASNSFVPSSHWAA